MVRPKDDANESMGDWRMNRVSRGARRKSRKKGTDGGGSTSEYSEKSLVSLHVLRMALSRERKNRRGWDWRSVERGEEGGERRQYDRDIHRQLCRERTSYGGWGQRLGHVVNTSIE